MVNFRNKFFLGLAFLAASVFVSLSVGGEFLHQNIHHHESQSSHDNCPVFQLLSQVFIFVAAGAFCLQIIGQSKFVVLDAVIIFRPKHFLPGLRAPPVSL